MGMMRDEQSVDMLMTEAAACYDRDDYQQAVDLYESALARGADIAAVASDLGFSLLQLGRLEAAYDAYRRGAESSTSPDRYRCQATAGYVLHELGRLDQAEATFRAVIDVPDDEWSVNGREGLFRVLLDQGRSADAEGILRPVLESGTPKQQLMAAAYLGELAQDEGRNEDARRLLAPVASAGHERRSPRAALRLALLAFRDGDDADTERWARVGLELAQGEERAGLYSTLGATLAREGRSREAGDAYRASIECYLDVGGNPARPKTEFARLLVAEGQPAEAERLLRESLGDAERRAEFLLGTLLADQGRIAEASEMYESAGGSTWPSTAGNALTALGNQHAAAGRDDVATSIYERVIALGETTALPYALVNLARIMTDTGDLERAEALLRSALAADVRTSDDIRNREVAQLFLAGVLGRTWRMEEAEQVLRELLVDCGGELRARAQLGLASVLLGQEREEGARLVYEEVVATTPLADHRALAQNALRLLAE